MYLHSFRSQDKYLQDYPCQVDVYYVHNHDIMVANSLRHRPPSKEVEEIFKKYFNNEYLPSAALDDYKRKLEDANPEVYHLLEADGTVCPTKKWCYDLYYKMIKKNYGETNGEKIIESLKPNDEEFDSDIEEMCVLVREEEEIEELIVEVISMPEGERIEKVETSVTLNPKTHEQLEDVFKKIKDMVTSDPATYEKPIQKFIELFNSVKSKSHYVSAFRTFGKYTGTPLSRRVVKLKRLEHAYSKRKV